MYSYDSIITINILLTKTKIKNNKGTYWSR